MIVHEGVIIRYRNPDLQYMPNSAWASGVVIEQGRPGYQTYTFHPYSGQEPVPCARPAGRMTYQLKGKCYEQPCQ